MLKRPLYKFTVLMHMNGRHPYIVGPELDYETQNVVMHIMARGFKHAEKVALEETATIGFNKKHGYAWSYSVKGVLYGHQPYEINPPKIDENTIRLDERTKIAKSLENLGNGLIIDPESDGVDGYCGAVLLELADTINNF